ncbi:energy-coupling factor ABC transporter ATP-binding protein [Ancylobacter sp. MQZ15Z-1]|uniref:Energy-coupling factor ABC transporter ATP-binding protein n=1 Tax=Ancylobacter mangrovi TaxID=2972472 RepID=A0A9X2PE94_9HYPH|nr:ABC transporter ATP-binding protein [Ancylobacter mangrovi]MCS0494370.1 energy-coupling factor ABC transporter ATP-binding protein [Ancylobacter mangrovi]
MPSPSPDPLIRLDKVTLRRGGRVVLDALSLELAEKRIGLIGTNGSGKSSLVRLFNGLLSADEGRVVVHGLDATDKAAELPRKVGFIFQNPDHQIIFPTVAEEVAFSLEQAGRPRREAAREAVPALARFGRAHWAERPVHTLSEGEKQLVCIIAVLVMEPAVLVFDEPFSSLDLPTRRRLEALIATLPQQVVMIAHELDAFAAYDRVIWLDEGRVRMDGPPDAVVGAYRAFAEAVSAEPFA